MTYGVVVAAGKSERFGPGVDKAFLTLGARPVVSYALAAFERCADIDGVVLVVRPDKLDSARRMVDLLGYVKVKKIVPGSAKRQGSVQNGLAELGPDVDIVVVHDGARPCVSPALISATVKSAAECGSGVAAVKVTDTVKLEKSRLCVAKTIDRTKLWAVQTPQAFKLDLLLKAFDLVNRERLTVTDEAGAVEAAGKKVRLVESSISNIKITTALDLELAAVLLRL